MANLLHPQPHKIVGVHVCQFHSSDASLDEARPVLLEEERLKPVADIPGTPFDQGLLPELSLDRLQTGQITGLPFDRDNQDLRIGAAPQCAVAGTVYIVHRGPWLVVRRARRPQRGRVVLWRAVVATVRCRQVLLLLRLVQLMVQGGRVPGNLLWMRMVLHVLVMLRWVRMMLRCHWLVMLRRRWLVMLRQWLVIEPAVVLV